MKTEDFMIPCMNKSIFGIDCLGCGTQRALVLIFNGDFSGAFYMFPAIYTLLLFFIFIGLHFIDKKRNYNTLISLFAILNGMIMIISYIYKMSF
ncbi:DUF2752 domain-containing protein [Flavobacterium sp.]|uniref:DUF2752 domain-containing protein n=1 Tax=Flavobacterium sp. TaxID=239 RepID=UPI00374C9F7D